jgi:hypothetical protein
VKSRGQEARPRAKEDLGIAEADVQLNETNLIKARIVSPINGVVLKRNVDPGQTVAPSLQAPILFTITRPIWRPMVPKLIGLKAGRPLQWESANGAAGTLQCTHMRGLSSA